MPLAPEELDALRFYPSLATSPVDQEKEGAFKDEMIQRVQTLPYILTPYAQQVICVRADGAGPIPAANLGANVLFGLQGVGGFKPARIFATTPVICTDATHCGARIVFRNTSAVTVNFSLSANPLTGVSDNFVCQLLRARGAAAVQMTFGAGITNSHPTAHTRVLERRLVEVYIESGDAYLNGGTDV